jgi:hypothetical protein
VGVYNRFPGAALTTCLSLERSEQLVFVELNIEFDNWGLILNYYFLFIQIVFLFLGFVPVKIISIYVCHYHLSFLHRGFGIPLSIGFHRFPFWVQKNMYKKSTEWSIGILRCFKGLYLRLKLIMLFKPLYQSSVLLYCFHLQSRSLATMIFQL